jgi:hypothetical protein
LCSREPFLFEICQTHYSLNLHIRLTKFSSSLKVCIC